MEIYQSLSNLSMQERKAKIRSLSSEMKAEVWRAHFNVYLARPDFTEEQKQVVLDAIALITPQMFEIPENSAEFQTKVHEPLEQLRQRFLLVFSREVASEILTQIGGPVPSSPQKAHLTKTTTTAEAECNCSITSDWCPSPMECHGGMCYWTNGGCGTAGAYACTGLCWEATTW